MSKSSRATQDYVFRLTLNATASSIVDRWTPRMKTNVQVCGFISCFERCRINRTNYMEKNKIV